MNKFKKGLVGLALTVAVASITPGCISVREGDDRISAVVSPFGASVVEETYEPGTDRTIGKKVVDMTTAFGNVHREVKFYGSDGEYRGGYKVKYDGVLSGNPRVTTEVYDSKGKIVRTVDGEEEIGLNIRGRMKNE